MRQLAEVGDIRGGSGGASRLLRASLWHCESVDRRSVSSAMSTDTDEECAAAEGRASSGTAGEAADPSSPTAVVPSTSVLLITANVGSVFEDAEALAPKWLHEVIKFIGEQSPQFVAIHFQEVGGKNVSDNMVAKVNTFVDELLKRTADIGYSRHVAFFDQNFRQKHKFTALGNLCLIHESIEHVVEVYDFERRHYRFLTASITHVGDFDSSSDASGGGGGGGGARLAEKCKFPLSYFPERRWSRKGYLRTRWRLRGTPLDLINVHLFHDASNLVSVESAPSVYCVFRRRALTWILDRIQGEDAEHERAPFFIFGDFNFRLDGSGVLKKLTGGVAAEGPPPGVGAGAGGEDSGGGKGVREFRDRSDCVVVALGKKQFSMEGAEETFNSRWSQWTEYDHEKDPVTERLMERKLSFPPTYPYEEDPEEGNKYMKTRVPAWCDRILYSHVTEKIVLAENDDDAYDVLGKDTCMGDHKPVSLRVRIRANAGDLSVPAYPCFHRDVESQSAEDNRGGGGGGGADDGSPTDSKCPRVESPTYTDLLSATTSHAPSDKSELIIYKDDKSVKVYKETTV